MVKFQSILKSLWVLSLPTSKILQEIKEKFFIDIFNKRWQSRLTTIQLNYQKQLNDVYSPLFTVHLDVMHLLWN